MSDDNYEVVNASDISDLLTEILYDKDSPHEVAELICLKCYSRWIGVYPLNALLKEAECICGAKGYIIKTGQTIMRGEEKQ